MPSAFASADGPVQGQHERLQERHKTGQPGEGAVLGRLSHQPEVLQVVAGGHHHTGDGRSSRAPSQAETRPTGVHLVNEIVNRFPINPATVYNKCVIFSQMPNALTNARRTAAACCPTEIVCSVCHRGRPSPIRLRWAIAYRPICNMQRHRATTRARLDDRGDLED